MHSSYPATFCANTPFCCSTFANSAKASIFTTIKIIPAIAITESAANDPNSIGPLDARMTAAATPGRETFSRSHRTRTGSALRGRPMPSVVAATCENSEKGNAVRAQIPADQCPAKDAVGTRKHRYQRAILYPFRLSDSGPAQHQNTGVPIVTQTRRFRNRAGRCQICSGGRGQCRLS